MPSRAFFLYTRSNDVAASRRFYSDLVGLQQIWDETGDIAYLIGDDVQFSAGTVALRLEPFWVGYWSYVVKDPMGQTVELSDPVSAGP